MLNLSLLRQETGTSKEWGAIKGTCIDPRLRAKRTTHLGPSVLALASPWPYLWTVRLAGMCGQPEGSPHFPGDSRGYSSRVWIQLKGILCTFHLLDVILEDPEKSQGFHMNSPEDVCLTDKNDGGLRTCLMV